MDEQKNEVVKWLEGKKTYAVAITILVCGVLTWQGVQVPEFVWAALAAFGLGFLRAGVKVDSAAKSEAEGDADNSG